MVGMREAELWEIVDGAFADSVGSEDTFAARVAALERRLRALPPERVRAFAGALEEKLDAAYRWDLWGAAYLLGGGCSDDGFTDFRRWLVSMGRARYEAALRDPETLVEVQFGPGLEQDSFFEEYGYVAAQVFEELTGGEMPAPPSRRRRAPLGEPWADDAELAGRLPRLFAVRA